jgi:hypothetical protein
VTGEEEAGRKEAEKEEEEARKEARKAGGREGRNFILNIVQG